MVVNQTLDNNTSIITCQHMLLPVELYRHKYVVSESEYLASARHRGLKRENVWCQHGGHEGHLSSVGSSCTATIFRQLGAISLMKGIVWENISGVF